MDEWKDFSLRNGRKFNILMVMRFILIFTLVFCVSPCLWAEDSPVPSISPTASKVRLEAKVVQIVLNDEHRQGVDWEAIVSDFHSLQLRKDSDPSWEDKKFNLSVGEVSSEDYAVLLDALDTVGRFSQKDFSIFILNKEESKVFDISFDPNSLPSINLNLMWFNSPAGMEKLKIDPIVGGILKNNTQPNMIVTLKNQTEVDLKDNSTIVIGGLMHEEEIKKTRKIPLLGDLPLVGLVFRKQGKLMQKTETIIFLTMHTTVQVPSEEQK